MNIETDALCAILSEINQAYLLRLEVYEQLKVLDGGIHRQLRNNFHQYYVMRLFTLYSKLMGVLRSRAGPQPVPQR
jgi:hypothetical protein